MALLLLICWYVLILKQLLAQAVDAHCVLRSATSTGISTVLVLVLVLVLVPVCTCIPQ
jgi:hypothetical protein